MCLSANNATPDRIAEGLETIEVALRRIDYWEVEWPEPEALQSRQPFCVDTLTFPQWLQFVFLPKMRQIVEQERPLPAVSGMAPMAEEFFRPEPVTGQEVIDELARLDQLLSNQ
ncbi:YqcC family protein [Tamilnaduibacter salinus]|uniref:YqcC family protein n=1 Tax=Tamilnaduibacter salinus TaxID=1484056 RepID=UPI000E326DCF|nr:YqcC family protein [Tamilnaduibacter salinus]